MGAVDLDELEQLVDQQRELSAELARHAVEHVEEEDRLEGDGDADRDGDVTSWVPSMSAI